MVGAGPFFACGYHPVVAARVPVLALFLLPSLLAASGSPGEPTTYRPKLRTPEVLEPFLPYLSPGGDSFPEEKEADELAARLAELGNGLKADPARRASATDRLLALDFRGGRLLPMAPAGAPPQGALAIERAEALPPELVFDSRSFAGEMRRLLAGLREVTTAELLITTIEVDRTKGQATTDVRYDIVGPGNTAWRVQHVGVWRMTWRREASGWRVVTWTAHSHLESRAHSPVFTEVTAATLGGNDSFGRQLGVGLDARMITLDSVLTRDSNGHHGVSVGDADGDGLDDLYVAQPSGLPNRLYRARGDGTFEDATESAGLGVLDDTAQSLFADVDNDGDQDLVLATATKPLLFRNDGRPASRASRRPSSSSSRCRAR